MFQRSMNAKRERGRTRAPVPEKALKLPLKFPCRSWTALAKKLKHKQLTERDRVGGLHGCSSLQYVLRHDHVRSPLERTFYPWHWHEVKPLTQGVLRSQ